MWFDQCCSLDDLERRHGVELETAVHRARHPHAEQILFVQSLHDGLGELPKLLAARRVVARQVRHALHALCQVRLQMSLSHGSYAPFNKRCMAGRAETRSAYFWKDGRGSNALVVNE